MNICSSVKTCTQILLPISEQFQTQTRRHLCNLSSTPPNSCLFFKQGKSRTRYTRLYVPDASSCFSHCASQACQHIRYKSGISSKNGCFPSRAFNSFASPRQFCENASVRILMPIRGCVNLKCNVGPPSWPTGLSNAGIISGLLVCYSTSDPVHAEAAQNNSEGNNRANSSSPNFSHGKEVYTDYSVIGIPGDGRCLFRSVAHGACLRCGKPAPTEAHQKQLADELRGMMNLSEGEKRLSGFDFDKYVSQVRKPHMWGGEPELLMLSHVLRMPITVYIRDDKYDGLISIAEYGQEYGNDNPIPILYHGYGHYDALQIPTKKSVKSRL